MNWHCNTEASIIAVGDRMFLGIQDFDFAQKFLVRGCCIPSFYGTGLNLSLRKRLDIVFTVKC